jgi:hypothetical protein
VREITGVCVKSDHIVRTCFRRAIMPRNRSSRFAAVVAAALGTIVICGTAQAQMYIVNGGPAHPAIAQYFAGRNLPSGYYWVNNNGNWGFAGDATVVGNLYGRHPSLSERRMLFSPGELMR